MFAFFSRRLRMWLLFSVVIPLVRSLWGRAKANRMAQKAQVGAGAPPAAGDSRTF